MDKALACWEFFMIEKRFVLLVLGSKNDTMLSNSVFHYHYDQMFLLYFP